MNVSNLGKEENQVKETILALLSLLSILIPIRMVIYEVWQIWRHSKTNSVSKNHYDKITSRRPAALTDSYRLNEDVEMVDSRCHSHFGSGIFRNT